LLLVAGVRHFQQGQFETGVFRQGFQDAIGFLAIRRAVVKHGDLLAFEFVGPAFARADVVDDCRDFRIRVELQREHVREHATVGGVGATVVDGDQWQFVGGRTFQRRVGNAHRQRVGRGGRRTIKATLEALVAFHALLHHILRFALAPGQLDAVHPTLCVDVLQVVDKAAEEAGATGGVGSDPIALQGEVLFVVGVSAGTEPGGDQGQA
jgi:hypothetical protein